MTVVKICGLMSRKDAKVAASFGARYIGAVMHAASPRNVDPEQARDFADGLEPDLVMVVADETPSRVVDWANRSGAAVVQLHGDESPEETKVVAAAGPWVVWKAVRARTSEEVWRTIRDHGPFIEGVLVDGWHPTRIGGTGVRVGWEELPRLRERLSDGRKLVAAGGLTPENVAEVVRGVRPHVVDVSSGVERVPGVKDPDKVRRFILSVEAVGSECSPVDNESLSRDQTNGSRGDETSDGSG